MHIPSAGCLTNQRLDFRSTILQYYVLKSEREWGEASMTPVSPNRSVRSAFQLLELLAGSPDGLRLARLADSTGLPKTTVHRLLCTLEELEVVCRDDATARFHLSVAWERFGGSAPAGRSQFSAPIVSHDGLPLAGLTLRVRGPVPCDAAADRLRRLVADLATAVSRRISA